MVRKRKNKGKKEASQEGLDKSHPRYLSLLIRERIAKGVERGITSPHGLIAHGRGEALDYLLGEKTHPFARKAIDEAARVLCAASHPIISVNGNVAALCPKELAELSRALDCPIEVNIFHPSKKRERAIAKHLRRQGAKNVLLPSRSSYIPFIASNRKFVHAKGILAADVVFVPLEDGDRAQALIKGGKKVVTIDLNPLSRTAKEATVTIVDNIIRAMPQLIGAVKKCKIDGVPKKKGAYSNKRILDDAQKALRKKAKG